MYPQRDSNPSKVGTLDGTRTRNPFRDRLERPATLPVRLPGLGFQSGLAMKTSTNTNMKQCSKCKATKPLEDFAVKNRDRQRHQAYCKECNKAYQKIHYANNKRAYVDKAKKYTQTYRKTVYTWMKDYVLDNPCVECGNSDFRVAHFDHLNQDQKSFEISRAVGNGYSLRRIKDEVRKCRVLCANCHALRTAEQFGWYKDL